MTDPVYLFSREMSARGLSMHKGSVVADGKLHRYRVTGDRAGKENGWYVLYLDGIPAGAFGSWKTGDQHSWCAKLDNEMTDDEKAANKARMEAARAEREAEQVKVREAARVKANELWEKANPTVDANHPYIRNKGIRPVGARQLGKMLVLPVRDIDFRINSLQFIMADGSKRFLTGGQKSGGFILLPGSSDDVIICEGWATACSLSETTGSLCVVCFDAGNLLPVAKAVKQANPDTNSFTICADDDYRTDGNPGLTKAAEAAEAIGARVVIPKFGDTRPDRATDFNDMHQLYGLDAVRQCLSGDAANVVDLDSVRKAKVTDDAVKENEPVKRASGKKKQDIDWNKFKLIIDRYVLIYGTDTCFDVKERMIMKVRDFRLAVTNDYANMWLKSPSRRMILPDQLVFDPSCSCSDDEINLFRGFDLKPKEGSFAPIIELLNHLCAESSDSDQGIYDVMDWVLKWLALPLQRPGAKMRSALVFHGPQGTGKNLFFEIIASIYGRYALVVGQEQLEEKHNEWMSQKLFLIGDEVIARQELYHQKNKLKAFITGETIQVNPKFLPLRTEKNHINVVFLSNEEQPLALEPSDRRYFVVYTPPHRKDNLYKEVSECIKNGGIEAFYHHLMHLDLSDFDEYSKPIMTVAKADLIELGMKPAQKFIYDWIRGFLPLPLVGCSVEQLYRAFDHWMKINGGKWAPDKTQFGSSARKAVDMVSDKFNGGEAIMINKPVRLPCSYDEQTMVRMWIPQNSNGPKEGQKIGDWAVSAIRAFESALEKYKSGDCGV